MRPGILWRPRAFLACAATALATLALGWLGLLLALMAVTGGLIVRGERADGAGRMIAYRSVVFTLALVLGLVVLAYLSLFAVMGAALESF